MSALIWLKSKAIGIGLIAFTFLLLLLRVFMTENKFNKMKTKHAELKANIQKGSAKQLTDFEKRSKEAEEEANELAQNAENSIQHGNRYDLD